MAATRTAREVVEPYNLVVWKEHVAIVYDSSMTTKDGTETNVASIEVFCVIDGKLTKV